MGGIHGKTKTNEATTNTQETSNASNVIDGGVGSEIKMTQITGAKNITMGDYDAIEKAFDFGMASLNKNSAFLDTSLDMVNESAERNYEFAENVAIPLNAQLTEDFTKYAIIAGTIVVVAYFYNISKRRK